MTVEGALDNGHAGLEAVVGQTPECSDELEPPSACPAMNLSFEDFEAGGSV